MNEENLMQLIYEDMQEVKRLQITTNKRLDGLDRRFESLEAQVLDNTEEIKKINLCLENHTEELKKIDLRLENHAEELKKIDLCLENHAEELKKIDLCLENHTEEIRKINLHLENHTEEIRKINLHLENHTEEIRKINLHLENHTEEIRKINLCLENEIRPSIMRIAEGHLDLSRKLDEALKIDQEKEKIALRLNFLEGKVERLESKVAALT